MIPLKLIGKIQYQKKTLKFKAYTLVYYENILKKLSSQKSVKNIIVINSFSESEAAGQKLGLRIKYNGHIYVLALLNNIKSTLTNANQTITYKLLIKSFLDFISALKLDDIILVSLSSSSVLATLITNHCPQVKKLFLISPLTPNNIIDSAGVLIKDKNDINSFVDNRLYFKPNQITSNFRTREIVRNQKKLGDYYKIFFTDLRADISERHWEHQLKKITIPVTIIRGSCDPISTVYDVENIKKHLKHTTVEYVKINKTRHYVYHEKVKQVAKIIAKSIK